MDDPYASLDSTERAYIGLHSAMMKMYSDGDVRFIDIANTLILVRGTSTQQSTYFLNSIS